MPTATVSDEFTVLGLVVIYLIIQGFFWGGGCAYGFFYSSCCHLVGWLFGFFLGEDIGMQTRIKFQPYQTQRCKALCHSLLCRMVLLRTDMEILS